MSMDNEAAASLSTGALGEPGRDAATPSATSLRALVEAVSDYAIFMLDPMGRIISWNPGAERIKGYRAHEIIGRHFSCFYSPDAVARKWPDYELEQAAATGRFEDEGWRVRKDGTTFWANVVITALRDSRGQLTGFAKITRDFTEQRNQQEALRESEERFKLLVERVRDYAIFMLDPLGNIVSWNDGAAHIKGYRREEVLGRHVSLFYPSEAAAAGKPARELELAARFGRVTSENWRVRKDGSMFWANVTLTAVYDEARQLRGFAQITRDMSERKRLEELEESSRRMSEFLATLAHELRNPLAPLRNAIGVLQNVPDVSAELARCRDMADRQLTQLTRLVDDLLDIGRITSGKIELRNAPVAVRDIIDRGVESVQPLAMARAQSISVELPEEPIMLHGDAARLAQVMQNLLNNASKFSSPGSSIAVRARVEGHTAVIQVADKGCGIAEDALETIFNLFVQEDRLRNPGDSGLGIGLTLCRSLVELHGGAISATSPGSGRGSTFTVHLPVARMAAPRRAHAAGSEAPVAPPAPVRVLVVDDNRDSADSLAMLLQIKGHAARVAYHADEAVGEARSFEPDLLLIDLAMPDIDGFGLLRLLRMMPLRQGTMFVAMTGFGQLSDRARTREAGFHEHLVKPVNMDQLDALLVQALERRDGA